MLDLGYRCGKHTCYLRGQVFGGYLFTGGRLCLEEGIAVIERDFMFGGLSLVAQVDRHLPLVVGTVFRHPDIFGFDTFRKLVFLIGGFQMQPFTEILLYQCPGVVTRSK